MRIFFPNENSEDKSAEYSALVEQWGNKTILEYKINSSLKQESWSNKRDGYRSASGEQIKGYTHSAAAINRDFASVNNWTKDEIASRNRCIADCFIKIWSIDPSDEINHFSHWLTQYNIED